MPARRDILRDIGIKRNQGLDMVDMPLAGVGPTHIVIKLFLDMISELSGRAANQLLNSLAPAISQESSSNPIPDSSHHRDSVLAINTMKCPFGGEVGVPMTPSSTTIALHLGFVFVNNSSFNSPNPIRVTKPFSTFIINFNTFLRHNRNSDLWKSRFDGLTKFWEGI